MNSINLIGNLTRDFDLKYSKSGTAYVTGGIAVQRKFKSQSGEYESDFINLKAFGKTAEILANHFAKGSKIGISGSLQTGIYENQQGQRVYKSDVLVEQVTFVERKNNNPVNNKNKQQVSNDPFSGIEIENDSLPF